MVIIHGNAYKYGFLYTVSESSGWFREREREKRGGRDRERETERVVRKSEKDWRRGETERAASNCEIIIALLNFDEKGSLAYLRRERDSLI